MAPEPARAGAVVLTLVPGEGVVDAVAVAVDPVAADAGERLALVREVGHEGGGGPLGAGEDEVDQLVGQRTAAVAASLTRHDGATAAADLLERLARDGGPVRRVDADPWGAGGAVAQGRS